MPLLRDIYASAGRPLLIAAAVLVLGSCEAGTEGGEAGGPDPRSGDDQRHSAPGRHLKAECCPRVVEVVDGDTLRVATVGDVRLIGVDTPERGRCYFAAATRFTAGRLTGRHVRLRFEAIRRDPWRRVLAYVHDRGRMHNRALVERGYAEALTIPPLTTYAEAFETAEAGARRRGAGQWSACHPVSDR